MAQQSKCARKKKITAQNDASQDALCISRIHCRLEFPCGADRLKCHSSSSSLLTSRLLRHALRHNLTYPSRGCMMRGQVRENFFHQQSTPHSTNVASH